MTKCCRLHVSYNSVFTNVVQPSIIYKYTQLALSKPNRLLRGDDCHKKHDIYKFKYIPSLILSALLLVNCSGYVQVYISYVITVPSTSARPICNSNFFPHLQRFYSSIQ